MKTLTCCQLCSVHGRCQHHHASTGMSSTALHDMGSTSLQLKMRHLPGNTVVTEAHKMTTNAEHMRQALPHNHTHVKAIASSTAVHKKRDCMLQQRSMPHLRRKECGSAFLSTNTKDVDEINTSRKQMILINVTVGDLIQLRQQLLCKPKSWCCLLQPRHKKRSSSHMIDSWTSKDYRHKYVLNQLKV